MSALVFVFVLPSVKSVIIILKNVAYTTDLLTNLIANGNLVLEAIKPTLMITGSGGANTAANTITFKSSPLKPLNQIKPNLAGMVPGWVPFKIVSDNYSLPCSCS
jgi:hypothetical protein